MTDRPMLFSGPMVRALLDGRKTQTRRVLKIRGHKSFTEFGPSDTNGYDWRFRDAGLRWHDLRSNELTGRLPFTNGDRLWVRETWTARMTGGWTIAAARSRMYSEQILYRADGDKVIDGWWSSIHMPREFSRLTLIVTDVRIERLQGITETDAVSEGIERDPETGGYWGAEGEGVNGATRQYAEARHAFGDLWDGINADRAPWNSNPWVCAITFTVHKCNIDQMRNAA